VASIAALRPSLCATTREEIETRRKAFIRKWRLKHRAVADSLEEAGDRLFIFTRLPPSQWRSARTTDVLDKRLGGYFFVSLVPFFCLAPCGAILPSRPAWWCGQRAQRRSRTAPSLEPPEGLVLDRREHGGRLVGVGIGDPRLCRRMNEDRDPRLDVGLALYGTRCRGALPFRLRGRPRWQRAGKRMGSPPRCLHFTCRSSFAASAHPGRFDADCFAFGRSLHAATNRTYAPSACATNARSTSRRDLML
jgi:hypothetical protein